MNSTTKTKPKSKSLKSNTKSRTLAKSKTKSKSKSLKNEPSAKGHPRNPNYKGKHYKTPEYIKNPVEKKPFVNKYKEFLKEPLKQLEEEKNKIDSLININKITSPIKPLVIIKSEKFDKWVKGIKNPFDKKLLVLLPVILIKLSQLVIMNKDLAKSISGMFIDSKKSADWKTWSDGTIWSKWISWSPISNVYLLIKNFFKMIIEHGPIGVAEIIVLTTLFLDDIPKIFAKKDLENLKDINKMELTKQTMRKILDVNAIGVSVAKEKEIQEKQIELTKGLTKNSRITEELIEKTDKLQDSIANKAEAEAEDSNPRAPSPTTRTAGPSSRA